MKNILYIAALTLLVSASACKNPEGEYVDLNSGQKVVAERDEKTGYMVNAETKKPLYLYVDTQKKDTFYGRTGSVVNDEIERDDNGMFHYSGDQDYVYQNGDYKIKAEADGDFKLKDGDYKLKVEEDGDMKVKQGEDYKKKVSEDGDIKIKDGDTKVKIEDGKVRVKKDD